MTETTTAKIYSRKAYAIDRDIRSARRLSRYYELAGRLARDMGIEYEIERTTTGQREAETDIDDLQNEAVELGVAHQVMEIQENDLPNPYVY